MIGFCHNRRVRKSPSCRKDESGFFTPRRNSGNWAEAAGTLWSNWIPPESWTSGKCTHRNCVASLAIYLCMYLHTHWHICIYIHMHITSHLSHIPYSISICVCIYISTYACISRWTMLAQCICDFVVCVLGVTTGLPETFLDFLGLNILGVLRLGKPQFGRFIDLFWVTEMGIKVHSFHLAEPL